jgi:hypothetical protein
MPCGHRLGLVRRIWIVLTVAGTIELATFLPSNRWIVGTSIGKDEIKNDAPRMESDEEDFWKSNTKILGFADSNYKEVAWRWYRRLEDLGYTTHAVVTNDEEAAVFFEKQGMRYDRLLDHRITKNLSDFYSCAYGETHLKRVKRAQNYRRHLFASRWHYIARQLQYEKAHILLTDVDNIFNRYQDMAEWEKSSYDVYHAFEGMVPSFPR